MEKKEITKKIIKSIFMAGGIVLAMTSPQLGVRMLPRIAKFISWKIRKKESDKKFYNVFYRLKKEGMIKFENRKGQIFISLTEEGKKKAGRYQIDDLKIKKPKKWDGNWRILIFDIKNKDRMKREALRGKILELGLFQLQKSVWVYPYDFRKEIKLLRSFFGLNNNEMQIIMASEIENDKSLKRHFRFS